MRERELPAKIVVQTSQKTQKKADAYAKAHPEPQVLPEQNKWAASPLSSGWTIATRLFRLHRSPRNFGAVRARDPKGPSHVSAREPLRPGPRNQEVMADTGILLIEDNRLLREGVAVRGEKVLPSMLTASRFTQIGDSAPESEGGTPEEALRLTVREQQVVDLIAQGMGNKEIATELHIATHTVKSHVHNIPEKLALSSRLQIAAFVHWRDAG